MCLMNVLLCSLVLPSQTLLTDFITLKTAYSECCVVQLMAYNGRALLMIKVPFNLKNF